MIPLQTLHEGDIWAKLWSDDLRDVCLSLRSELAHTHSRNRAKWNIKHEIHHERRTDSRQIEMELTSRLKERLDSKAYSSSDLTSSSSTHIWKADILPLSTLYLLCSLFNNIAQAFAFSWRDCLEEHPTSTLTWEGCLTLSWAWKTCLSLSTSARES